jgi:hypothetical protein
MAAEVTWNNPSLLIVNGEEGLFRAPAAILAAGIGQTLVPATGFEPVTP